MKEKVHIIYIKSTFIFYIMHKALNRGEKFGVRIELVTRTPTSCSHHIGHDGNYGVHVAYDIDSIIFYIISIVVYGAIIKIQYVHKQL